MGWKRVVGRLLLVGAGGGCLVLLMFVGLPLLTELQPPEEPAASKDGAVEVPNVRGAEKPGEIVADGAVQDVVGRAPTSLVAVKNNGDEIAVVFPVAGEQTQDETPEAVEGPPGGEREEIRDEPAEGLPPVLSPEEVAAAMAGLEANGDAGEPAAVAQVMPDPAGEGGQAGAIRPAESLDSSMGSPSEGAKFKQGDGRRPEVVLLTDAGGARHVEVTLPPASATRDVQELLEALGYAPGPLDGIWGERTAAAWRNYARDAAERAAREERAQSHTGRVVDPPVAESPTPSGATVEAEGDGAGQAGETRPLTGLPPQPVALPDTLRGVMGYRIPLVSRQGVPDQVVSGVLIPAHTTFVILKPGYWELVGLEPDELERLRDAPARRESEAAVTDMAVTAVKRGWNPLRLFRRQGPSGSAK